MITPQTLATLTNLDTVGLAAVLDNSGYKDAAFTRATFLGIAKTGNFVYEVEYKSDDTWNITDTGHVYVSYDHERGAVTADY